MLREPTYHFIRALLLERPHFMPTPAHHVFGGGFVPQFRSCHLTAMQVAVELGYEPVLGVMFLNFQGMLSPWAHVVNRSLDGPLLDFSPQVQDPRLAFVELGWHEFHPWRDVLADYHSMTPPVNGVTGDPLMDALTQEFLPGLSLATA